MSHIIGKYLRSASVRNKGSARLRIPISFALAYCCQMLPNFPRDLHDRYLLLSMGRRIVTLRFLDRIVHGKSETKWLKEFACAGEPKRGGILLA